MKNITKFQGILLAVLIIGAIAGAAIFAISGQRAQNNPDNGGTGGPVALWGTVDSQVMNTLISSIRKTNQDFTVSYTEIREESFDQALLEGIAGGRGPDAIILPHELIMRHRDKVIPISYQNFGERDFRNTYIEGGEIFMFSNGILGLPLLADPMVMYWNRDMFSSAGIAQPPREWEELFSLSTLLTERSQSGGVTRSTVAFGEYQNVTHAKDMLATLLIQAGNPIVSSRNGALVSTLPFAFNTTPIPAQAALVFYTDFADPVKPIYSWNRALPNDRTAFLSGDLALYFGFASELPLIRAQNPNLNFDVARMPQPRTAEVIQTYGDMYAVSVLQSAANAGGAFSALNILAGAAVAQEVGASTSFTPARRDVIAQSPGDLYKRVFYESALTIRTWLDPDPRVTGGIFRDMIESVTTGRSTVGVAIQNAHAKLQSAIR